MSSKTGTNDNQCGFLGARRPADLLTVSLTVSTDHAINYPGFGGKARNLFSCGCDQFNMVLL